MPYHTRPFISCQAVFKKNKKDLFYFLIEMLQFGKYNKKNRPKERFKNMVEGERFELS